MWIGIDLGGTKIECVALDDRGAECWRKRIAFLLVQPVAGRTGWVIDAAVLSGALVAGAWGVRSSRRRLARAFTRLSPVMLDAVTGLDCGASDRIA